MEERSNRAPWEVACSLSIVQHTLALIRRSATSPPQTDVAEQPHHAGGGARQHHRPDAWLDRRPSPDPPWPTLSLPAGGGNY